MKNNKKSLAADQTTHLSSKSILWENKAKASDLYSETSVEERSILHNLINEAITHFLADNRAVYLERFGIIFPKPESRSVSQVIGDLCVLKTEENLTPSFEKCSELISLHRERLNNIVETAELASYIFLRMPLESQLKWAEAGTRRYLRALIDSIRNEVIFENVSNQLSSVGELFSLHNRQGENIEDWFAGADILLVPNYTIPKKCKVNSAFRQPKLQSAWELFEAAFGAPILTFKLALVEHIEQLGYDKEGFLNSVPKEQQEIAIATFIYGDHSKESSRIVLVTDRLRQLSHKGAVGTELVTQIVPAPFSTRSNYEFSPEEVMAHIDLTPGKQVITTGWVIIQSAPNKTIDFGRVMALNFSSQSSSNSQLAGVITTPFARVNLEQRSEQGRFKYVNLTGITEDELKFANHTSAKNLLVLMQQKRQDQLTDIMRRSIFGRQRYSKIMNNTEEKRAFDVAS